MTHGSRLYPVTNARSGRSAKLPGQKNRMVATVRVAEPLTDEQRERLRQTLRAQAGRDVAIQEVIDENVVGGVRVELGDEVIEGTVASRLHDVRRLFS